MYMAMKSKLTFRVYPALNNLAVEDRSLAYYYWQIEFHKSRRTFLRKYRDISAPSWVVDMRYFALFDPTALTYETVSHEAVHLATGFIRLTKISKLNLSEETDIREEILAYTIGACVKQIMERLNENEIRLL